MKAADLLLLMIISLLSVLLAAAAAAAASSPSPSPAPSCSSLRSLLSPCVSFVESKQEESPTDECCSGLENVVYINSTCACDLESMSRVTGIYRYNATLRLLDLPKLCSVAEFNPTSTCNIQVISPPPPSSSSSSSDNQSNDSSSSPSLVKFPSMIQGVLFPLLVFTLRFLYY